MDSLKLSDYPDVMTIKQAADFLQLHYQTVREKVNNKQIPAVKMGRIWRIMKCNKAARLGVQNGKYC